MISEDNSKGVSRVLRMPNPGSDVDTMTRIFRELYRDLHDRPTFELDDITRAMINRNNVTSQGALGEEALRRSTRPDRSRDPLYNQSKMYAEVYRALGLIKSASSALVFRFSLLGQHLGVAVDPSRLLRECLLGLAYPNRSVEVKGNHKVRLFVCILRFMAALSGKISRDEIILGPMSIGNDRDGEEVQNLVRSLRELRSDSATESRLQEFSEETGISTNTMQNYTRIPIGALLWTGWAVKQKNYFHITQQGVSVLRNVESFLDLRLEDFDSLAQKFRTPLIRATFYEMLGRAGFDLSPVREELRVDREKLVEAGLTVEKAILFSPFQELSTAVLDEAFGETQTSVLRPQATNVLANLSSERLRPVTRIVLHQPSQTSQLASKDTEVRQILANVLAENGNDLSRAIDLLRIQYESAAKGKFYPLVTSLFKVAGFRCELTRPGVNSTRADARIVLTNDTIPIEIKSPSEEMEISVKAIRQALENKIVFLSRKMYPCDPKTSTLVVGFNAPNPRSEVHDLVEEISTCFNVNVGIFDFNNLIAMTLLALRDGLIMNPNQLKSARGLVTIVKAS